MIFELLGRFFGLCFHDHRYRARRAGVLSLVCDVCGHTVPAIARDQDWVPSGQVPIVVTRQALAPKSNVTPMRTRRKA